MRTTNVEGGMKDDNGESIRQTELRASYLCPCFLNCFKSEEEAQPESHNRSTISTRDISGSVADQQLYNKVLPNNN